MPNAPFLASSTVASPEDRNTCSRRWRRAFGVLFTTAILGTLIVSCGGSGGSSSLGNCGNGRLDDGELCDDGNLSDTDACTSACLPARCGDNVVQLGVEDCDGINLNAADCSTLHLSGGAVLHCTASCRYDASSCG